VIVGQDLAVDRFRSAMDSGSLHHAWLLAGPRGVGKASFAEAAAARLLAEAAGPPVARPGLETPQDHPIAKLVAARSHPDLRWLQRLPKEKGEGLARNISVKQIRELIEFLGLTPALSSSRAIVIDTADELEASGANALLKMLEEPPPNSVFFLVSHSPGRLLPTIRSRCRRLDFRLLGDDAMTSLLDTRLPQLAEEERRRLVAMAGGSAGRAIAFAGLGLAGLEEEALAMLREGDETNARCSSLAQELGRKGAVERYAAFLDFVPSLVAREARRLGGRQQERAIVAYAEVRELAALAPRLTLDPAATVFQIGGILASVAAPSSRGA